MSKLSREYWVLPDSAPRGTGWVCYLLAQPTIYRALDGGFCLEPGEDVGTGVLAGVRLRSTRSKYSEASVVLLICVTLKCMILKALQAFGIQ